MKNEAKLTEPDQLSIDHVPKGEALKEEPFAWVTWHRLQ